MERTKPWDAVVIGGGIAGLSGAIYLARARRRTLVIDHGKSMARWVPDVENYLGFPKGIEGAELLRLGRKQARHYGAEFVEDTITTLRREPDGLFQAVGERGVYGGRRALLTTGLRHLPPEIPGVSDCLGQSMFFCKHCDAVRCEGKRIGIFGWNDEAVEYALGMLLHSPCVFIFQNDHAAQWSSEHARWLTEYEIPIYPERVVDVHHARGQVRWLELATGARVELDALFTTRGDVYHNHLARQAGAETDPEGQVRVNQSMETNVRGLYAAGCVTPANCQMIIAAGDGATAAQAMNRSLFDEDLATHSLHRYRVQQLYHGKTEPTIVEAP